MFLLSVSPSLSGVFSKKFKNLKLWNYWLKRSWFWYSYLVLVWFPVHSLSQMVGLFLHLSNMGLTLLDAVLAVEENTKLRNGSYCKLYRETQLFRVQCWVQWQRAKKVVFDSPGLVALLSGQWILFFTCQMGKWSFFEEFKLQKNYVINPAYQKIFGASWNQFWASNC